MKTDDDLDGFSMWIGGLIGSAFVIAVLWIVYIIGGC